MKRLLSIAGLTFFLFILGLFSSSLVMQLTEKVLGKEIVATSVLSSFTPRLSFGFLLAFCSINAGGVLWAYSRGYSKYDSKTVFGIGLLISLTIAVVGIGLKLLALRYIFSTSALKNEVGNYSLSADGINYFSWGFGLVLFVNAVLIAILLWLPRQRQKDIIAST
jgi:hypothetical protein